MELAELTDADGERNASNYLGRCIPAGTNFLHVDVTMAFLNGVLKEDTNYVMHAFEQHWPSIDSQGLLTTPSDYPEWVQ